ncbi:hypothetical protein ACFWZ2_31490 [Streptomyces sp. NPDC059002]|uniref:hypothetical protein n=1 Tax=Streptomyces sp. NPDC059002 TaxID=3346690 RepID=UPI003692A2D5
MVTVSRSGWWPALLVALAVVVPATPSYAAESAPHRPVVTVDETSRAGSGPGEGRERPGRAESVLPDPAPPVRVREPGTPPPAKQAPDPEPEPQSVARRDAATDAAEPAPAGPALPGLRVLPLGGGLVLIGLGIGFLGLRLRRG